MNLSFRRRFHAALLPLLCTILSGIGVSGALALPTSTPPYVQPGAVKLPPTDPYSTRYHNPDGTTTAVIYNAPIRQRTANGWQEFTGQLGSGGAGYAAGYQGRASAQLPGTSAGFATVTRDGRSVSFSLAQASASNSLAQPDGQTLAYPNALPGTDLALAVRPDGGIKETLTVKSRTAAPSTGMFIYQLQLSGLDATPFTDDTGSRVLLSQSGTHLASPVLTLEPPTAVDAHGVMTNNCWFNLADDRKSVVLVVDPNFLAAAAYPVTIDPTIQPAEGGGNMGTFVAGGIFPGYNFGTDSRLAIGSIPSDGFSNAETFLRFNLNALTPGATIQNAQLSLTPDGQGGSTQVDFYSNIQAWDQTTITQGNSNNNLSYGPYSTTQRIDPTNSSTWKVDVTSTVTNWFNGSVRNYGMNLEWHYSNQGIEFYSNQSNTIANWPALIVTYYSQSSDPGNTANAGAPRSGRLVRP